MILFHSKNDCNSVDYVREIGIIIDFWYDYYFPVKKSEKNHRYVTRYDLSMIMCSLVAELCLRGHKFQTHCADIARI